MATSVVSLSLSREAALAQQIAADQESGSSVARRKGKKSTLPWSFISFSMSSQTWLVLLQSLFSLLLFLRDASTSATRAKKKKKNPQGSLERKTQKEDPSCPAHQACVEGAFFSIYCQLEAGGRKLSSFSPGWSLPLSPPRKRQQQKSRLHCTLVQYIV